MIPQTIRSVDASYQTMPLHLLRRTQAIYEGERDVILQLLHQIRKVHSVTTVRVDSICAHTSCTYI